MKGDLTEGHRGAMALTSVWVVLVSLFVVAGGQPAWSQQSSPSSETAAHKQLVAVLDFSIEGGSKAEASAITNQVRAAMLNSGKVTLVDRSQIKAILNEQAFQQTGCTSSECAVQVGRILGVRRMVFGSIDKLSDTLWQVSAQLTDVETAQTLRAATVTFQGKFVDLLVTGVSKLAAKLLGGVTVPVGPAAQGRAAVISYPTGADIVLDGRPVPQETDSILDQIAAGQHSVVVTKGDLTASANFQVLPGGLTRVEVKLEPKKAVLNINSTPLNASVTLDGQDVGRTPLVLNPAPGKHTVEIALNDYHPISSPVTIGSGESETLNAALQPKSAGFKAYEDDHETGTQSAGRPGLVAPCWWHMATPRLARIAPLILSRTA